MIQIVSVVLLIKTRCLILSENNQCNNYLVKIKTEIEQQI